MDHLHKIYRIEDALQTGILDSGVFERFAQDILTDLYDHVIPTTGGTDYGRDADIFLPGRSIPTRLHVTTSGTLEGVRSNMLNGISSMREHDIVVEDVGIFTSNRLSQRNIESLRDSASSRDVTLNPGVIYDQTAVASFLRRDGAWCQQLLGISAEPLTLVPLPATLAESPWRSVVLVGRKAEQEALEATAGDVILTGYPGVGKSRLAAELTDAAFADTTADRSALASDLLWARPPILIVDDAGRSPDLIQYLVQLRRTEPDLLKYRILAITWPYETDAVRDHLNHPETLEIGLLEPAHIDTIVEQAGVQTTFVRDEIVRQAEGRPGWALALTDVLLTGSDPARLFTGSELRGRIEGYLRRSNPQGISTAKDLALLTVIAAVDAISDRDLGQLADATGIQQMEVRSTLRRLARGGLIDSRQSVQIGGARTTHYHVRPPVFAQALVAEQIFDVMPALVTIDELLSTWPDKKATITENVIAAALLGSPNAADSAHARFRDLIADSDIPLEDRIRITGRYGAIDSNTGQTAAACIDGWVIELGNDLAQQPILIDVLASALGDIAARHLTPTAIETLLTLATYDSRAPNQAADCPIRKLDELVHQFHPELPLPATRPAVLAALQKWIDRDEPGEHDWRVLRSQIENLMSLEYDATYTRQATPNTLQMYSATAPPDVIDEIVDTIWPAIVDLAHSASGAVKAAAVEAVIDWMRLAQGFGGKFGATPSEDVVERAREVTPEMQTDIEAVIADSPGLVARLADRLEWLDGETNLAIPEEIEPFLRNVDLQDHEAAIGQLTSDIKAVSDRWPLDNEAVLETLIEVRYQIQLADVRWPPRINLAYETLVERIDDPEPWIEDALDNDLFPDATALLRHPGGIPAELWQRCFETPNARSAAMNLALTRPSDGIRSRAIDNVQATEFDLLYTLALRSEVDEATWRDLLTRPDPTTRGAVAAAIVGNAHRDETWTPGELATEWLDAIEYLDPAATLGLSDWHLGLVIDVLTSKYPDTFTALATNLLTKAQVGDGFAFPHSLWDHLHRLKPDSKTEIWEAFKDTNTAHFLRQHLVGTDIEWLETMLQLGAFTIDDALSSYSGLGPHPTTEQLALLLIPMGADPRSIASLESFGLHMGEESEWSGALVERFTALADDDDDCIAKLGRAGVEIYTERRRLALEKERGMRIRGEL